MSRKVTNTRITANAFKINHLEYKYYETMVNMRLKQYNILLKTYNRLMCEHTSFKVYLFLKQTRSMDKFIISHFSYTCTFVCHYNPV